MKIHHLNCGSHRPAGGALFDGASRGPLVQVLANCLLVEAHGQTAGLAEEHVGGYGPGIIYAGAMFGGYEG